MNSRASRPGRTALACWVASWLALAPCGPAPVPAAEPVPAAAPSPLAAPPPLDIIAMAIARWQARPRPANLSYTVQVDGRRPGGSYLRRFHVDYTAEGRNARVTELAASGQTPPFVDPEKQRLFPDETFGFVSREASVPATAPSPETSPPRAIGTVRVSARYPYDVKSLGVETVDRHPAYHLQLAPRGTPDVYALRELWIDSESYDLRKAVVHQTQHVGPLAVPYLIQVWYGEEGPYWLIRRVDGSGSVHVGLFNYESSATATFGEIRAAP